MLINGLGMKNKVLLIDNYDSFTYNLMHLLQSSGAEVIVKQNDDQRLIPLSVQFDKIVVSPGPSLPKNSGLSKFIVETHFRTKPILGVCLGMQIINEVFSGKTIKAPYPVHGKSSTIEVDINSQIFKGTPKHFTAARYHSLICSEISSEFFVTAWERFLPMAFEHKNYPLFGLQFHPESFLSAYGQQCINNFLQIKYP